MDDFNWNEKPILKDEYEDETIEELSEWQKQDVEENEEAIEN